MEAIPADDSRVGDHEQHERNIPYEPVQHVHEVLPCEVEVDEPTDEQCDEVHDQGIVIRVIVDETDIQQDQHDIERARQPDRGFLLRFYVREPYKQDVEPVRHEDREEQEHEQQDVLILDPDRIGSRDRVCELAVDHIVEREEKENRRAREDHLIETLDEDIRAALDFPDLLPAVGSCGLHFLPRALLLEARDREDDREDECKSDK